MKVATKGHIGSKGSRSEGGDEDGHKLTRGFRIACNTTAGLIHKCIKPIRRNKDVENSKDNAKG